MNNATLKLTKNHANAKQHPDAESYSHSSLMLQ